MTAESNTNGNNFRTPQEVLDEIFPSHGETDGIPGARQEYVMTEGRSSVPVPYIPEWAGKRVEGAPIGEPIIPTKIRS